MEQKIVIIDNYDSFTYNLYHLVREQGCSADVLRNDRFELQQLEPYHKIILSPGPGIPREAGLLMQVIQRYAATKPILGVCLGHQAIGEAFGASLTNLSHVFHGVQTPCHIVAHDNFFSSLPDTIQAGRYHSWVIQPDTLPGCLQVTARSDEGHIMAIRHTQYDVHGIQFHPESVLTPQGGIIISNFLNH